MHIVPGPEYHVSIESGGGSIVLSPIKINTIILATLLSKISASAVKKNNIGRPLLVTHIQNILFCVPQKRKCYTGLKMNIFISKWNKNINK